MMMTSFRSRLHPHPHIVEEAIATTANPATGHGIGPCGAEGGGKGQAGLLQDDGTSLTSLSPAARSAQI